MKNKWKGCFVLIITINLGFLVSPLFSQNIEFTKAVKFANPLSLANIFNALTGTSIKLPISKRNKLATQKVLELGIDFSLTPDIEKELRKAKASDELITAIRLKSKILYSTEDFGKMEVSYWKSIVGSNDEKDFDDYLKKYPRGRYVALANERLFELHKAQNLDASFSEEIPQITNTDDLGIAGTWIGLRGLESDNAFLFISGSKDDKFTGILKLRGFQVVVQGKINQRTRQMKMQEVKIIETRGELNWTLSAYTGEISRDKKEFSGMMKEGAGNIAWAFTKVD